MIACPEMIAFNRSGWTWHLRDSSALDPWFDEFLSGRLSFGLGRGSGRHMVNVESYGRGLLVKYDRPKRVFARLKSRVMPLAKAEYEAALLLEDMEIPSAECLGWGRRGPESILVCKGIPNSYNALDFWLVNVCAAEEAFRQPYLVELARFMSCLFSAGLSYSGLQLSSLAVSLDPFVFHVVSPYGVSRPEVLEGSAKCEMFNVIGALRGEINTGEAAAMMMYAGLSEDPETAVMVWNRILKSSTEEVDRRWRRKRSEILGHDSRYCVQSPDGSFLVRCGVDRYPLVEPGSVHFGSEELSRFDRIEPADHREALRVWLTSFKLYFHRIRHRLPVLMELDPSGRPFALHMERRSGIVTGGQPSIKEFVNRCRLAGISDAALENNIDVVDGKIEIADISKVRIPV